MDIEKAPEERDLAEQPTYELSGWETIEEVLDFRNAIREERPGTQVLFILDDYGQALYTSGHAVHLYPSPELDLAEFSTLMTGWLREKLEEPTAEFDDTLIPIDDPDIDLLGLLQNPSLVFRSPLRGFIVASDEPSMAIAAQPNGYFTGDLTAAQNYLIAERLREQFGLEIFGLGSSSVAYCRDTALDVAEAQAIVDSFKGMYDDMTDELAAQWAALTAGKRWFLLSYLGA